MNTKNLILLADYLKQLPDDYDHFRMDLYSTLGYSPSEVEAHCGTVGCALGHAPLVEGLPNAHKYLSWSHYVFDVFGLTWTSGEWHWCFAPSWYNLDNTPQGAAQRIYCLVNQGLPDNWKSQMLGIDPLSYQVN